MIYLGADCLLCLKVRAEFLTGCNHKTIDIRNGPAFEITEKFLFWFVYVYVCVCVHACTCAHLCVCLCVNSFVCPYFYLFLHSFTPSPVSWGLSNSSLSFRFASKFILLFSFFFPVIPFKFSPHGKITSVSQYLLSIIFWFVLYLTLLLNNLFYG